MSATSFIEASLPKSIETYHEACARGSQYPSETLSPPTSSPLTYSESYLARSRSSNLVEAVQDQSSTPIPPSSLAEMPPTRPRSDNLEKGFDGTSSPSDLQCPELQESNAVDGGASADYLPHGFEVLPKCCYNYQPYISPPPPAVLPWSRKIFISLVVSTCPPVFLSCNLINPVHLASIMAPGCKWPVIEEIAEYMTPALNWDFVKTEKSNYWKSVKGVLLCGLLPEAIEILEGAMARRYKEGYKRCMEDVMIELEDEDKIEVAAYMYRKA